MDGAKVDVSFATQNWQKVIRDRRRPGYFVRRHFEATLPRWRRSAAPDPREPLLCWAEPCITGGSGRSAETVKRQPADWCALSSALRLRPGFGVRRPHRRGGQ
ncbi:hypothetical protein SSAG_00824 [Streptomyces sp. Mg1]|nr:hypothetical protein SSAG_00824 [Streptomyces sp. Mg1]